MSHPTPTYRAIQVVEPGHLELTELPVRQPEPGHVRIRVEACGVCHSDSVTVEGVMPVAFPRVPGHEVVGRIDAVGQGVSGWAVGQRVGVGFLAGPCGTCGPCRDGDFVNCTSQPLTGVHMDGGYAEMLIARASGLVSIPPELDSADAAPLLCAGLTTFDALRDGGAGPGDLVAVLGIGGLGHLAVQYARSMGFKVAVVARGAEKREVALDLGAHFYIDSLAQNASLELIGLGGARLILATAGDALAMSDVIAGLRAGQWLFSASQDNHLQCRPPR